MKPKSLLDPSFRYVPSHATNIAKTFARIRREQAAAQATAKPKPQETAVVALRRRSR